FTSLASNELIALSIDQVSGGLTKLSPSVPTGEGPTSISVDPQGQFVHVANAIEGTITTYAVDGTTGALTPRFRVLAGTIPVAMSLDPAGRFAYVANQGSGDVTTFSIDSTTGALTRAGTPADAGTGPSWLTLVK